MCHLCQRPAPGRETRRDFLGKLLGGLTVSAGMLCASNARAQVAPTPMIPTTPVSRSGGWARLVTPSPFWSLHAEQDATVAEFLRREARLKLDAAGYSVNPANLDELATFPLIFTNSLAAVTDPVQLENIREYLQRGGFFYIEGCLDHRLNRSFTAFMANHLKLFEQLAPGAQARRFGPTHPIFRAYFPVEEAKLALIEPTVDDQRWAGTPQALYGIFQQNRLISLISLAHLQCEWFTKPEKIPLCLRQIANIYVYAMTR